MLKFVYSFFLGLLLVIFVGMGIASFYAAPKAPEYPKALQQTSVGGKDYTAEQRTADANYQKQSDTYNKRFANYNRNVSMIVLGCAVVLMAIGLAMHGGATVLADGLLLGGTFTLIYSIGRSFASDDPKYSFAVVSIGLAVTVVMGYLKFIKPVQPVIRKKK